MASNYFSTLKTKSIIEPPQRYNAFPELRNVPKELEMDFSRILHKPFFVENISWLTTNTTFTEIGFVDIPSDVFVSALAKIPFQASTLYRCKISLMLQVSGTPMHQGIIVASAMPFPFPGTGGYSSGTYLVANSLITAPHVFLNANEGTAVMLEVPFFYNSPLAMCQFEGETVNDPNWDIDFARVSFYVMNPLFAPTGASSTLTISVYAMFTALEFYVPHTEPTWTPLSTFTTEGLVDDLRMAATKAIDGVFRVSRNFVGDVLDTGRAAVRHFTGLHSPNYPELIQKDSVVLRQNNNSVDCATQYEKLDPFFKFDRIMRDHFFDTTLDEMSVREILSKPQLIGRFGVTNSNPAGTLLWSRPITPLQEGYTVIAIDNNPVTPPGSLNTPIGSTLQRTLALMSRFWKGGLKIHIQASMSNFHFCKLTIARNYSTATQQYNGYPDFDDVNNLLTEVIEFSGGGQIQTVTLPYCSALSQLPVTADFRMNSMQHGMYYIYLNQPLVTNGTVSPSISFNVYLSVDDDFELYGYSTLPLGVVNIPGVNDVADSFEEVAEFTAESQATVVVNEQTDVLLNAHQDEQPGDLVEHRPILSVRDWMRRNYSVLNQSYNYANLTNSNGTLSYDINSLFGSTRYYNFTNTPVAVGTTMFNMSNLAILRRLFLGYRGGFKFKIVITGSSIAKAYYLPPAAFYNSPDGSWIQSFPIPLTATQGGYAAFMADLSQQYAAVNPVLNGKRYRTAQTVCMERPNYVIPTFNDVPSPPGSGLTAASCIMEFEVPYMAPYRFMGHATDYWVSDASNAPAASDMGSIVLNVVPNTGSPLTSFNVEIFMSIDDTARLGYQVFSPPVLIPCLTNGAMAVPYTDTTAARNVTANQTISTTCPACYYSAPAT